MTDTREFPTAVIASVCTGVLLCEFGKMHEAAELAAHGEPLCDEVREGFDRWLKETDPDGKMDVYQVARAYQRQQAA